ncbi:MAG: histidine phosphatase family protein [Duncaniella sp.]|nr:histidine phosphatase family protein [Duncaniella sp.]
MISLRYLLPLCFSAVALTASPKLPEPTTAQLGGNHFAYPHILTAPEQTPAPEGYKPFHIEHYGRHGSRYHIGQWHYDMPVEVLEKAEKAGVLTSLGMQLLDSARVYRKQAVLRDGDLSDIGALQHQAIGRRIGTNYPEIFKEGTHIDAKSTTVRRCILSMLNEVKELQALYPSLLITTDCSDAEMYYMNACSSDTSVVTRREAARKNILPEFQRRFDNDGSKFLPKLFTSSDFARDSVDAPAFASATIQLLQNTQNHSAQNGFELLEKIFTRDEIKDDWIKNNAYWFIEAGNTPLTGGNLAMEHAWLLDNFIQSADTAVTSANHSVNLRFGHDSIVLPLAILMQLNDLHRSYSSLEDLYGNWANYAVIPMAGNIQMIFYRPEGSTDPKDVIVKVLLNEEEVTLPVAAVDGPYVKWTDLRNYYRSIIDPYLQTHSPRY